MSRTDCAFRSPVFEYKGPRYNNIKNIVFEIQIRTISMDACANISHYLDYKSDTEIPKDLKKDFFALSGLFYVADTHFEMFYKNKKEHLRVAQSDLEQKVDADINFETLVAYLNQRFKNRKEAPAETISYLIQELDLSGYKTIKQLDKVINDALMATPEELFDKNNYFNRAGIVRRLLRKTDPKFEEVIKLVMSKRRNKK